MTALRQLGAQASRTLRTSNAVASTSRGALAWGSAAAGHSGQVATTPVAAPSGLHLFTTSAVQSKAKKVIAPKQRAKRKQPRKGEASGGKQKRRGGGDQDANLSRTNVFLKQRQDMSHLQELLPDHATEVNVNNVYALSQRTLDAMRYPGGFGLNSGLTRHFRDMPRPRTLLRPQSLQLFGALDEAGAQDSGSTPVNALLHAPVGSGMSTLLLQSLSYALESGWICLYIPRALQLVDSSSSYVYSEAHQTYLQPDIARQILQQLLTVNGQLMRQITVKEKSIPLTGTADPIQEGANLADVARIGALNSASPTNVHVVFDVVLRTLVQQRDVPVLFAIDGMQGLFSTSHYRDPDYRPLESYELGVPRTLHACLRTSGPGAYGGIQRGAMLATLNLQQREWPIPRELAMRHPVIAPELVEPYAKLNETIVDIIKAYDLRIFDLTESARLTQSEAGAIFDVARREEGLWSVANDEFLMAKLVESGGSLGTFDRSLRKSMV